MIAQDLMKTENESKLKKISGLLWLAAIGTQGSGYEAAELCASPTSGIWSLLLYHLICLCVNHMGWIRPPNKNRKEWSTGTKKKKIGEGKRDYILSYDHTDFKTKFDVKEHCWWVSHW